RILHWKQLVLLPALGTGADRPLAGSPIREPLLPGDDAHPGIPGQVEPPSWQQILGDLVEVAVDAKHPLKRDVVPAAAFLHGADHLLGAKAPIVHGEKQRLPAVLGQSRLGQPGGVRSVGPPARQRPGGRVRYVEEAVSLLMIDSGLDEGRGAPERVEPRHPVAESPIFVRSRLPAPVEPLKEPPFKEDRHPATHGRITSHACARARKPFPSSHRIRRSRWYVALFGRCPPRRLRLRWNARPAAREETRKERDP